MKFKANVVLSVVDGRLLCDLDDLYKLLSYMLGWSIMTHEIPGCINLCRPYLTMPLPVPPQEGVKEWYYGMVFEDVDVLTIADYQRIDMLYETFKN